MYLGVVLNNGLSFEDHLKMILNKVNKTIGFLRKLQNIQPRSVLLTIYKNFIRAHLDYGDIIYDQAYNASFHQKLELLQYNTCLAVTQLCPWFRKLTCFYKLFHSEHPHYLFKLIPSRSSSYVTKNIHNIPFFKTRHTFLKNSFFPPTIIEWNKLDHNIRNSSSFNIFRKSILKFIRPSANSFFNYHDPEGIKFITRPRLGLSHLREHKFKHSFQDSLNPFCTCG